MCEFGEIVSNQFNVFDGTLCQCNWYAFPIEMQRLLVTFMTSTQRPAIIRGYANTEFTRDAFKSVNYTHIMPSSNKIKNKYHFLHSF